MYQKKEFQIRTREEGLEEITGEVEKVLSEAGFEKGLCLVFSPHSTAGITINENEPGLKKDVLNHFRRTVSENEDYMHNKGAEKNATSHIKTILTGSGEVVPVEKGVLDLGTWQEVFLMETDGPRKRTVKVCMLN